VGNNGATEAMRILNNGNVGIGTTAPVSALNVSGTTGLTWAANGTSSGLVTIGTPGLTGGSLWVNTSGSAAGAYASGLGVTGSGTGTGVGIAYPATVNINAYAPNSANYGANLAFSVTNGTVLNKAMRIVNNGNVGIGTTAPITTLDLNGTMRMTKNSFSPYTCDAAHDAAMALTSQYTTCICKNGAGWISTRDSTVCLWATPAITATGGVTTTTSGNYTINKFTSNGTFVVNSNVTVDFLIVAGGGPGSNAAGGGAGGYIYITTQTLTPATYNVVVGAGGVYNVTYASATNGSNSTFNGQTAIGGGKGSASGGSGGGEGGVGTVGQGNNGGSYVFGDGGGGGAGAAGVWGTGGGAGLSNSITGTAITYAGGGGGGRPAAQGGGPGGGGAGGGGNGGNGASPPSGNGTNGLGGGGGGGGDGVAGGNGGSGVVIIRTLGLW
jgi:hypothetical protein